MKYLFGPVKSRRLGISLGIDLLPYKTCSLDCVYCECGGTTKLTNERSEYVNTREVISEIDSYLSQKPLLDYVTFSGSGEPTLHNGIGSIIRHIKEKYPEYKVCVLTNSTLLTDSAVRKDISEADLIVPSVDAMTDASFEKILRPHLSLNYLMILEGVRLLRKEYKGKMIVEYFVVPGINDSPEEISLLKDYLMSLSPDSVHLNYLSRPGAEDWVKTASDSELEKIASQLYPVHVQTVNPAVFDDSASGLEEAVLSRISTYSTTEELSVYFGLNSSEMRLFLGKLEKKGLIEGFDGDRWRTRA